MKHTKSAPSPDSSEQVRPEVSAGLPGASPVLDRNLRKAGIDPDRLSILHLGLPAHLHRQFPAWMMRMLVGYALWLVLFLLKLNSVAIPPYLEAVFSLVVGLLIIQVACQVLVTATERFAARMGWTHYVAGTASEILSTLPELVVIAFLVPVSPLTAFIVTMVTIYNNTLVFSIYSFFLPKNYMGKFLMPKPITDAGTQVLIAGGALGLVLGVVMLVLSSSGHPKQGFEALDLAVVAVLLLIIFVVYLYKLVRDIGKEEDDVQSTLQLTAQEMEERQQLAFKNVERCGYVQIALLLILGVLGAVLGGESIAEFASLVIDEMGVSGIVAALILAVFAGMSEYVILWTSHRKKEYGIALANAFGGIAQLLYLTVPFTFLAIAYYQSFVDPNHADFPLLFSVPNILLLIFLFPTMHTLASLLEKDHTMDILDTTIMVALVGLLLILLVAYGAVPT
ncbi:sodium/calcium exchanger protein [Paraglaciecola sp.]|uniref:sodium/calcium exchanger protein n=1 Tax=Paraglaciecola sp. TaxID=1920173 RepID=UPI0032981003